MKTTRLPTSIRISLCAVLLAAAPTGAPGAQQRGVAWTPELLRHVEHWRHAPEDREAAVVDGGLKVTIPPGRAWWIAAANDVRLPERVGTVRVRVARLADSAEWFLRVYGDLRGDGRRRTLGLFQDEKRTGDITLQLDPRLLPRGHGPLLQVQLGLEGRPGDHVVFESLDFLAPGEGPKRPRRRQKGQRDIECVTLMPDLPKTYKMKDWNALARAYDRFVFDFNARGQYLPLIWIDDSRVNFDRPTFGLPSYAGDPNRVRGTAHEGITCMGAVLGATVAGIDKRRQEHDYVLMCEAYYNTKNGERLVLNGVQARSGGSFWYEIWPHIVFYALADRYPGAGRSSAIMKATADRWCAACEALRDKDGAADFDHTAFRFETMKPVDNGKWKEPDAAAGVAWLEFTAWVKFRETKYLEAAESCLRFLQRRKKNPYYEVLLPYGTLAAARMNAELGRSYDVDRFLNWCFGISDCRGGWGVIATSWHGYDCHGLLGSVDNRGGYAFAMNTFAQAAALVPLVRYDDRYARAIGKWMLNLASAARLFYPGELPDGHESCAFWKGDPGGVIAYEGLRYEWEGKGPFATGDPVVMKWGPATDRGLYGSGYVGLLGGIVRTTNVEGILQLDCLATDFHRPPSHPTYLYYNPYRVSKLVRIDLGDKPRDLYDACTDTFIDRNRRGLAAFTVPADSAVLLVLPPPGGRTSRSGRKRLVDGIVIDY